MKIRPLYDRTLVNPREDGYDGATIETPTLPARRPRSS